MQRGSNGLAEVLSGFDRFLIDKCLVPDNHVRWVRDDEIASDLYRG